MLALDLDQSMRDSFIRRPNFRQGTPFKPVLNPVKLDFPVQRRSVDKEGRLRRKNFLRAAPQARIVKSLEEVEALKTKQEGIKIRFGQQLGTIRVMKRDKDGNPVKDEQGNPIFEEKEFNLAVATLPILDRIDLLKEAAAGNVAGAVGTTQAKLDELGVLLASILQKTGDVEELSTPTLRLISTMLDESGNFTIIPDATVFPELEGFKFVTGAQWRANQNDLQLRVRSHLMANLAAADPGLNFKTPVFGVTGQKLTLIGLNQQFGRAAEGQTATLDLATRRLHRTIGDARAPGALPVFAPPAAAVPGAAAEQKQQSPPLAPVTAVGVVPPLSLAPAAAIPTAQLQPTIAVQAPGTLVAAPATTDPVSFGRRFLSDPRQALAGLLGRADQVSTADLSSAALSAQQAPT